MSHWSDAIDGDFLESLFHQILVRTIKWTQSNNNSTADLYYRRGKFLLDDQHLLILTVLSMKYARMKVQILRLTPPVTTSTGLTSSTGNTTAREEPTALLADTALVAKVAFD